MTEKATEKASPETTNAELILELTSDIAAAYFDNNTVAVDNIPAVITAIYQSLTKVHADGSAVVVQPEPAVPVKKSVTPEYIICLEDGKQLKMLKRHLKTSYNMTPDQYRDRWGLPADYPMVAPNYAKQRSRLAKQIGLGTSRRTGKSKAA